MTAPDRGGAITARHANNLFKAVVDAYVSARLTEPVSAINHDFSIRPRRWTPQVAEYIADVESSTARALRNSPILQAAWNQIAIACAVKAGAQLSVSPCRVTAAISAEVALRCGRVYHSRNLDPREYFAPTRREGRS